MTRPKFANNSVSPSARRPKTDTLLTEGPEEFSPPVLNGGISELEVVSTDRNTYSPSIAEFMSMQMQSKEREPTRPITLRFEESLWQKVESLRGNLSKNDFFKELVQYYDKHSPKSVRN
jgi:hypothetical protein